MKKLIKIFLISLLILFCITIIGIIIFIKTFDFNSLKPYIVSASQSSLGRSLDFKDIGVKISLAKGVQLSLTDLAMGENPDFGKGDFLSAQDVRLGVSIKDFILKRQINILNVEALSPEINIIRLADGRINVQSFSAKQESRAGESAQTAGELSLGAIPALFINKIAISEAKLRYIDYSTDPALSLEINQIKLETTDISLTQAFPINISAAFLSDTPDISLKGEGKIDLSNLSFLLTDAQVDLDLSLLSMDKLRSSLPQMKQIPLFDVETGKVTSLIKLIEVGPKGLTVKLDAQLKDGKIFFEQIAPGISLLLNRIQADINGFSLNEEFSFNIEAAYLNQSPNIKIQGKAVLNLGDQTCKITGLNADTDLSSLSLEQLASSVEALKNIPLPQEVKGKLKVDADNLIVGSTGLTELKAQASLSEGSVRMKELAVPIDAIEAKCDIDESKITLDKSSFSLGKGKVEASGDISDYLGEQKFAFKAKADGIDIAECLDQKASPVKVEGLVFGDLAINGQGLNPDNFVSRLGANSTIEMKEGKLTDINILKLVLDKLSFVPNLAQTLEANLPDRFKEKLKNKDTVITGLTITSLIRDGSLLIQPLNMEADGFIFSGNGSVGLDQSYALEGRFIIPQDLAEKILETVPEMEILLDSAKQIVFPLKAIGKGSSVSFYPDVASIGTAVIKNKAQEELGKVLNKVFGKDEEQEPQDDSVQQQPEEKSEPGTEQTSEPAQEKKDSTEQLIQSISDIIFGQ